MSISADSSPDELDRFIVTLTEEDIRLLTIISRANENAVCILPPTQALLELGLVTPAVDHTARPIERHGWRCTATGEVVFKRITYVAQEKPWPNQP